MMMKVLHIIATPRGDKSRTLSVSQAFLDTLLRAHPDVELETLDLFNADLPSVSGSTVDAKYVLMGGGNLDETLRESWERITSFATHFLSFDVYLITTPMWNFGVPYRLKHYIDVIMHAGIIIRFTEHGAEGFAENKKMICITSRGSDYGPGSKIHSLDHQEPYLRTVFNLAGIQDITFINAQPLDLTPAKTKAKLQQAKEEAERLAQSL